MARPLDGPHMQSTCYQGSGDHSQYYLSVNHYSGRANQISLFSKVTFSHIWFVRIASYHLVSYRLVLSTMNLTASFKDSN